MDHYFEVEAAPVPGRVLAVSLADKTIIEFTDRIGLIDGVEAGHGGDYLVTSHMAGELLHIDAEGKIELLLKVEAGLADLDYIRQKEMVIMPLLRGNKLIAYKINHQH